MAFFYILYSPLAKRHYIGHTTEPLTERLRKHNSKHKGYTGKFGDWRLMYSETLESKEAAYKREREVKNWKDKSRLERLISGLENPG